MAMGRSRVRGIREHLSAPLFRNAYFLILSSSLSSALGLPFWALTARDYSPATVGRASAMLSALGLISGIASLGMSNVLPRYLPSAGEDTLRFVLIAYGTAIVGSLILGTVAAATSHFWSPPLGFVATDSKWFALFVSLGMVWAISGLQDFVMTGLREARWVPLENTSYALAKIVLVVVFASSHPQAGVILAWMLPMLATLFPVNLAIFARFIPRHVAATRTLVRSWGARDVRRLVLGNFVGDFSGLVIAFFLPILVLNLAGVRQAAYFYVPWTITLGVRFISQNMATSMTVETAFDEAKRREHLRSVAVGTARLLIPTVAVVLLAAPYILDIFGRDYADAGTSTLRLLILGTIPHAVSMLGLGLGRLQHDGRFVGMVQGTDAIVMLAASTLLIPSVGIAGAGIGWLLAQSVAATLCARRLRTALSGPVAPSAAA
jgi:O-antigen/teichoic acid export membrane protein